ncbi:hypothetical protein GALL_474140 [mine drainage metagenome]|uniref:Uncharacterized protein n=1 Tax=mine drainage metagenome TaxID=410659 RepID=A0A1J5PH87_9ZZZZ
MLNQQHMDILLRHHVIAQCFAHIQTLGRRRNQRQYLRRNQAIMNHHFGPLKAVERPQGH